MIRIKIFLLVTLLGIGLFSFAGPNEDLVNACKQGDMAAFQAALDAGADVNSTDASGNTPICNAYFWPEMTRILLEKGADPNGGNNPALINACNSHCTEVVEMLLDAGADPNKPTVIDQSGMYRDLIEKEKAKGKKKANKALIKAYEDAIANAVPTKIFAATALVMQTNHVAGLKMMIDAGMKLELEDGSNALQTFANYANSREARKALFAQSAAGYAAYGVKVPEWLLDLSDEKNGKATEMLELLLDAGLDMNKQDANGFTPLCALLKGTILAAENTKQGKLDAAKMLIERGADVNASSTMTGSNWTYYPVCLAAELADMEVLELLVEKGANLDNTVRSSTITLFSTYASVMGEGGDGYTATIIALVKGNYEVAGYLIEQGADLTIGVQGFATLDTGKEGLRCLCIVKNKSPIFWAIERSNMATIEAMAAQLQDVRLPDFTSRSMSDVGRAEENDERWTFHCPKFKKSKYSPSEYSELVGRDDAAKYLSNIGL